MAKEREFNMKDVITNHISKKDIPFFDGLEDYQVRQLPPLIMMKWMKVTNNKAQVLMLNELLNTTVFHLYKHPKLCYKLMMVCSKSKGSAGWLKPPSKHKDSQILSVVSEYYDCSFETAERYLKLFSNDDILEIAEMHGIDKETMTKLKKELNERDDNP
jgi:hypothetical protein